MIVCSCNVLSDHQIRALVGASAPRMTSEIYGCLDCRVQCGRCARTIRRIMDQAQAKCSNDCDCCPRALAKEAALADDALDAQATPLAEEIVLVVREEVPALA
jgi:bacterioferritin-associated ferredoxin